MYETILKHKPNGATHWQAGVYYKKNETSWLWWNENDWYMVIGELNELCMTRV